MEENNVQAEATMQAIESNDSFKNVIKDLMSTGKCRKFNDLRIKNVNISEEDNYTRVSFTVNTKIPGYISKDNGETYELGENNVIYSSTFALAGMLKENEELSWMANALRENPAAINIILNGGTIDVIQHRVNKGEPYHNPFTTKDEIEETVFDHDTIINYVVGCKLGKTGQKYSDIMAIKMMGF